MGLNGPGFRTPPYSKLVGITMFLFSIIFPFLLCNAGSFIRSVLPLSADSCFCSRFGLRPCHHLLAAYVTGSRCGTGAGQLRLASQCHCADWVPRCVVNQSARFGACPHVVSTRSDCECVRALFLQHIWQILCTVAFLSLGEPNGEVPAVLYRVGYPFRIVPVKYLCLYCLKNSSCVFLPVIGCASPFLVCMRVIGCAFTLRHALCRLGAVVQDFVCGGVTPSIFIMRPEFAGEKRNHRVFRPISHYCSCGTAPLPLSVFPIMLCLRSTSCVSSRTLDVLI